jgi:DNA repair protein RadA/Sms
MAKTSAASLYQCSECGWQATKWAGRCGGCQAWGSLDESARTASLRPGRAVLRGRAAVTPDAPAVSICEVNAAEAAARPTGMDELDRVLGGGLVPGTVALLAGEPGVGKSTLLLEAGALVAESSPVLYLTGEESVAQVKQRADRIGAVSRNLFIAAETDLAAILAHVDAVRPAMLIVDSVQTITATGIDGAPGGVAQVREITSALVGLAKQRTLTTVLVGHVTKDGSIAGPRSLEHLVDVVLQFEGDSRGRLRMIRALKNRFGPTDEIGCFELGEFGLIGLPDPSGLFLSRLHQPVPGTCVSVTLEGRRPLVAEVQTLVCKVEGNEPSRRVTSGLDYARVGLVVAVLQRRTKVDLARSDVYAATVGGVRLSEPALDLAVALALAGGKTNLSLPADLVAFGEVGLAGEIRSVAGIGRRLAEASRMGFRRAIVPIGTDPVPPELPIEVMRVADVRGAISAGLGARAEDGLPSGCRGGRP